MGFFSLIKLHLNYTSNSKENPKIRLFYFFFKFKQATINKKECLANSIIYN